MQLCHNDNRFFLPESSEIMILTQWLRGLLTHRKNGRRAAAGWSQGARPLAAEWQGQAGVSSNRRSNARDLATTAEWLEDRCLLVTIAWDGGVSGTGTNWNAAANWVGDVLPGSGDDAQIGAGFTGITYATDTRTIRSLTTSSDVTISSGALTILVNSTFNAAVNISQTGNLTLGGLTVGGIGSLTNAGTLSIDGSTIAAPLVNQNLLVVTHTSTISGTLTTDANSIIRVQGLNAGGGEATLNVANSFTNNGRVELLASGRSSTLNVTGTGSTLTNEGVIQTGGTDTTVLGAQLVNHGTLDVSQPLNLSRPSAAHSNSGTINVTGGDLTVTQSGTAPRFTNSTLGTFTIASGRTLNISGGTFGNFSGNTLTGGIYNISGTLKFDGAAITTNAANIVLDGASSQIVNQSNVNALTNFATNAAAGNFTIKNGRNFTTAAGITQFANQGQVTIGTGTTFAVSNAKPYVQSAGTSNTIVNGTLTTTNSVGVNIQGGSLRGIGSVTGNMTNAGQVSPGSSVGSSAGVLTVNGNYTQNSSNSSTGTLNIEVGGVNAGVPEFDQLNVTGTANVAGTLNVSLINGYTPTGTEGFRIITANSLAGTFNAEIFPAGLETLDFAAVYDSTGVSIQTSLADNTSPTLLAINRLIPAGQETNATSVVFQLTFSEPVTGVEMNYLNDLSVSGTGSSGAALDPDATHITTTDNIHWSIPVTALSQEGTVSLNLVQNTGIFDLSSNGLATTVFTSGQSYIRDTTVPTASLTTSAPAIGLGSQASNTSTVTVTYADGSGAGIDASTFGNSNITVDHGASVTGFSANNNAVTYTISAPGSDWDHSFQGTYTIGLANTVKDRAGNSVAAIASLNSFVVNTAPTLSSINRLSPTGQFTNAASVTFLARFTEPVANVTANDFVLPFQATTGGSIETPTSSDGGTTWSISVSGLSTTANGSVRLDLANATDIADLATNALATTAFSGQSYTLDHTAPTLSSINRFSPASEFTNGTSVTFQASFSENVTGVTASNFTLSGTAGGSITSLSNGGSNWFITVSGLDGIADHTVGLDLANSTNITDLATNALTTSTLTGQSYTLDDAVPSLSSISRSSPSGQFTNGASVTFLAAFSEKVAGVAASNFSLPFFATTGGAIESVSTGDGGSTWSITVSDLSSTANGSVRLDLANNTGITDLAGNPLSTATLTGQFYTLDHIAPALSSITRSSPTTPSTNQTSVTFLATFSENVTGVSASNFRLPFLATTGGIIGTPTSGNGGSTWSITVSGLGSANGTVELDWANPTNVTDLATNSLTTDSLSGESYAVNYTAPSLTSINRLSPTEQLTNAASVTLLVTFSSEVANVTADDFTLPFSTITGETIEIQDPVTNDGGFAWSITVSGLGDATGTVRLDLNNPTDIVDLAGNALTTASFTGQSYSLDHTAPTLSSIRRQMPTSLITNASTVAFEVTFSEFVTGVDTNFATDFELTGPGAFEATLGIPETFDNIHWLFLVSTLSQDGTLELELVSNAGISDQIANDLATTSFNFGETYELDYTPPRLLAIDRLSPLEQVTVETSLTFQATFSESVTGVDLNFLTDFSLSGAGAVGAILGTPTTSDGVHWSFPVTSQGARGKLELNLVHNTDMADQATNLLATTSFTTGQFYLLDFPAPATVYVDDNFTQALGTTIADADLGVTGNQSAIVGITAFKTITAALAAVSTDGTIIVNGGTYSESVTLSETQTLQVAGDDTPQTVVISALTTGANQLVQIDGASHLTIGNGTSTTIAGVISGTGSLTKVGTGTLALSGTNTLAGSTTIDAGILLVTGATSSASAVTVNGTGTLAGTGTIGGSVAVASGGNVAPGNSPGILNSGNVSFASGSNFHVEIDGSAGAGAVGGHDQLNVTGTVDLSGVNLVLTLGGTPANGFAFTIINNDGSDPVTGTFKVGGNTVADGGVFTVGGNTFVIDYTSGSNANDVTLTVKNNTLTATIVGNDLVIEDIDDTGKANLLSVSRSGANLVISDANEIIGTAIAGAVFTNNNKTVAVPVSALGAGGKIIVKSQGGSDSLTVDVSTDLGFDVAYQGGSGISDSLTLAADTVTSVTHAFTNANDGSITIVDGGTRVITYTGLEPITDNLTATDRVFTFNGGAEAITLTDATGAAMTIDSDLFGEAVTFATPTGSLTINSGDGNDTITIGSVDSNFAGSLSISGGTGNDTVNLNADITFAADKSLDVDLQNDDAAPGIDSINVGTNANLILSGSGTATLTASKSIALASGSSIVTVNGNLDVKANQQGTATIGNFPGGVDVFNGLIQATGTGAVTVQGRGSDNNSINAQFGVQVRGGGDIIGGTSGLLTVQGTGGTSAGGSSQGVNITGAGSTIASNGANVAVTGTGGAGTGAGSTGIEILSGGQITARGSGTVTVVGQGGNATGGAGSNSGVNMNGFSSTITSSGSNVSVTGIGGGALSGFLNMGVRVAGAAQISAGASGTVTVVGQGGNRTGTGGINIGVNVTGISSKITSSGGNVSVTGTGGGAGSSTVNVGVRVDLGGQIAAGLSGSVTVMGQGGNLAGTGGSNVGVNVTGASSTITSSGGNVSVTGIEGGSASVAFDIHTSGVITTGTNGGTLTLIGNSMKFASSATISAKSDSSVTIRQRSNGVAINLGATTDPSGGPLNLTDAELDLVTAGTLQIGDANSGAITFSESITRTASTNISLTTGSNRNIAFGTF